MPSIHWVRFLDENAPCESDVKEEILCFLGRLEFKHGEIQLGELTQAQFDSLSLYFGNRGDDEEEGEEYLKLVDHLKTQVIKGVSIKFNFIYSPLCFLVISFWWI